MDEVAIRGNDVVTRFEGSATEMLDYLAELAGAGDDPVAGIPIDDLIFTVGQLPAPGAGDPVEEDLIFDFTFVVPTVPDAVSGPDGAGVGRWMIRLSGSTEENADAIADAASESFDGLRIVGASASDDSPNGKYYEVTFVMGVFTPAGEEYLFVT